MIKVDINKNNDRYDCFVKEDGKYTGQGTIVYSLEAARAYKERMEKGIPSDPGKIPEAASGDALPGMTEDKDGQLLFDF